MKKYNLRIATVSQNQANRPKPYSDNPTSKYKGVKRNNNNKNNWSARITVRKKEKYLGTCETEEQAALLYNKAAIKYFGEFAYLNDIKIQG